MNEIEKEAREILRKLHIHVGNVRFVNNNYYVVLVDEDDDILAELPWSRWINGGHTLVVSGKY